MPEWLKGADCKSAASRYVGSNPTRPKLLIRVNINFLFLKFYRPVILIIIVYKSPINTRKKMNKRSRSF